MDLFSTNILRYGVTAPPIPTNPDGTYTIDGVLYGPNYGPLGPTKIIVGVWNQADVGYCYETDNDAEALPAKWASRGINTWKPGHPDVPLSGRAQECLAAVEAAGLMMIAAPLWDATLGSRVDTESLDFRELALNDPYWRVNWINYQISDEIDLQAFPLSTHETFIAAMPLDGVRKPISANFTRRVAIPSANQGSATIHYHEAFNVPELTNLSIDSYEWHLTATLTNSATPSELRSSGDMFISTWHGDGVYTDSNPNTGSSVGRRFTSSASGRAVHLMRNGPISPGRSDDGLMPVDYPPIAFNDPPYTVLGAPILPQPMDYVAGDKATGHYVATGRVDVSQTTSYANAGYWQPGRFLRNEAWSGFVHGSSALYLFPQTVGGFSVTGYVDAGTNTFVATSPPVKPMIGGAMRVISPGGVEVGWIRRDSPQVSGTTGSTGTYALDTSKVTPVTTGSLGTPVVFTLGTEARPWGDDTNPENLDELTNIIANLDRMQAHPTGGNLLIDTVNGGRRVFTTMRCPDIDGDLGLYREDMTLAPMQEGYTLDGTPILDSAGGLPLWEYGWPMGFEGFRVTGDDGAVYIYVRSLSNGERPTWFPGYASLGLPARVFGPFELVGFRRLGEGSAVEMTGVNGVLKADVDDGPATWYYIESVNISQDEGNSGNTSYNVVIRRGGSITSSNSVTATVTGTGVNPANAADFEGGVMPSQVKTFGPGVSTQTFVIKVVGDATAEFDETFKVTLSSPSGLTQLVGSRKDEITCTIVNDDAPLSGAFIWLVNDDETSALGLSGSPIDDTYLKANPLDASFITRDGITMRSRGVGSASNSSSFASVPYHVLNNSFQSADFQLTPGDWEVALIVFTDGGASGTVNLVNDPDGTPSTEYTQAFSTSVARLNDTTATASYSDALTAVGNAVNNLVFVPVTVTDAGGGQGLLRLTGSGAFVSICAIAIREA